MKCETVERAIAAAISDILRPLVASSEAKLAVQFTGDDEELFALYDDKTPTSSGDIKGAEVLRT